MRENKTCYYQLIERVYEEYYLKFNIIKNLIDSIADRIRELYKINSGSCI